MVFVDGELGDDEAGDGIVFAPFRSLRHGIEAAEGSDVYVRSVGTYDVSDAALAVDATTSIYGGYDDGWLRDVWRARPSRFRPPGCRTSTRPRSPCRHSTWLGTETREGAPSVAVSIDGAGSVTISDSNVTGGAGGVGAAARAGRRQHRGVGRRRRRARRREIHDHGWDRRCGWCRGGRRRGSERGTHRGAAGVQDAAGAGGAGTSAGAPGGKGGAIGAGGQPGVAVAGARRVRRYRRFEARCTGRRGCRWYGRCGRCRRDRDGAADR